MADDTQAGAGANDTMTGGNGQGGNDTQAGGNGQGGAQDPWYAAEALGLDQGMKDYIATKNPGSFADTVGMLQNFERLARDRNVLPMPDATNPLAWEGFEKLGWTKDIKDYDLGLASIEGYDATAWGGLMEALTPAMHAQRIPIAQAQPVIRALAKFGIDLTTSVDAAVKKSRETMDAALRADWGSKYGENSALAQRAIKALDIADDDSDELNAIISSPRMIKAFHKIGGMLAEDQMDSSTGGSGQHSSHSARAERKTLEADEKFMASLGDPLHPAYATNTARRNALLEIEAKQAKAS